MCFPGFFFCLCETSKDLFLNRSSGTRFSIKLFFLELLIYFFYSRCRAFSPFLFSLVLLPNPLKTLLNRPVLLVPLRRRKTYLGLHFSHLGGFSPPVPSRPLFASRLTSTRFPDCIQQTSRFLLSPLSPFKSLSLWLSSFFPSGCSQCPLPSRC